MVITRESFTPVVQGAFAGLGFPSEAPTIIEFPNRLFVPGSDLSPIEKNLDKIICGLTEWQPKTKAKGVTTADKISVTGKDYQGAVDNLNNLFLRNLWSDGLPLVPPTEERVNWILRGTGLSRNTVVGKILPQGRLATVESLAIVLAMAGGRPEYLPVLVAAVQAFTEPLFRHDWMNTTTGAVFPAVIVSGPLAKQLRLNSGYGCLGPSPNYPAGGPIGRAIRLLLITVGGGIAGMGTMSIHGANRYTNFVFAEDEDGLPPGWESLSVERGFSKGSNVVTVIPACDYQFIGPSTITKNGNASAAGQAALDGQNRGGARAMLDAYAVRMGIASMGVLPKTGLGSGQVKDQVLGIALIARRTAAGAASIGMSRRDLKKALWENSKKPWAEIERTFSPERIKQAIAEGEGVWVKDKPWPLTRTPEQIMVVVAGGEQSDHASWVNLGGASGYAVITKEMKLPSQPQLAKLLEEAEIALGPIPTVNWTRG